MNTDHKQLESFKAEYKDWSNYLNDIIGALCFTTAISCTSSPHPQIYAALSLAFFYVLPLTRRPRLFAWLKLKDSPEERLIRSEIIGKQSIWHSIPFLAGTLALWLVAVGFDSDVESIAKWALKHTNL